MDRGQILSRLSGSSPPAPAVLVENQTVYDIIEGVKQKHIECAADYDRIANDFYGGELYDVCYRLWKFCKKNLQYDIEGVDRQYVSHPITMLERGTSDCKGYALFIGGVLDAMKRQGEKITWVYRFASYKIFNSQPGHVFIVVDPGGENIWIDPVLSQFNEHYPYVYHQDMRITAATRKAAAVTGITCPACVGDIGDVIQPVPAGYPSYLPVPVMTSAGALVLRGGSVALNDTSGINWIKKALQPLIIQYSPTPYNINWSISGWGSGTSDIWAAGNAIFGNKHNFLNYPSMPSGLDKIEMGVNNVLPTLVGDVVNLVAPGAGTAVAKAVASDTAGSGINTPVTLSTTAPMVLNTTTTISRSWMWWALGGLAALLLLSPSKSK